MSEICKSPPLISYKGGQSLKDLPAWEPNYEMAETLAGHGESCRPVNPLLLLLHSIVRGSSFAKRAEVMQSQGKTRHQRTTGHQLITHATCNLRITHNKRPRRGVTASLFLRREMKQTKAQLRKSAKARILWLPK